MRKLLILLGLVKMPEVTCVCCGWKGVEIAAHSLWDCQADPSNVSPPLSAILMR